MGWGIILGPRSFHYLRSHYVGTSRATVCLKHRLIAQLTLFDFNDFCPAELLLASWNFCICFCHGPPVFHVQLWLPFIMHVCKQTLIFFVHSNHRRAIYPVKIEFCQLAQLTKTGRRGGKTILGFPKQHVVANRPANFMVDTGHETGLLLFVLSRWL